MNRYKIYSNDRLKDTWRYYDLLIDRYMRSKNTELIKQCKKQLNKVIKEMKRRGIKQY